MRNATRKVMVVQACVAALCGCAATFAHAGGNGNGGNGSGGAHGAATAGMTYHGEPVTSPWNRTPGDTPRKATGSTADMPGMTPREGADGATPHQ